MLYVCLNLPSLLILQLARITDRIVTNTTQVRCCLILCVCAKNIHPIFTECCICRFGVTETKILYRPSFYWEWIQINIHQNNDVQKPENHIRKRSTSAVNIFFPSQNSSPELFAILNRLILISSSAGQKITQCWHHNLTVSLNPLITGSIMKGVFDCFHQKVWILW
jgi:hypothetical protein